MCSLPQAHPCIAHASAAAVQCDMTSIIMNLALVASCQSIIMSSNIIYLLLLLLF